MRVPSAEHVNLTAIHLHGWSIGWKVYTRKKQLGSRVEEDASRRADRQINIGRSRFIVMHPRYCVSKTLYVYPSAGGVHVHTAACPEFKGGESISSRVEGGEWNRNRRKEGGDEIGRRERKEWDEGDKQPIILSGGGMEDFLHRCSSLLRGRRSFLKFRDDLIRQSTTSHLSSVQINLVILILLLNAIREKGTGWKVTLIEKRVKYAHTYRAD